MKFGQLLLRRIIKIVATKCQILRLKCTIMDFGSSPDPAGEAYSAASDPLAGFKGPSKGGDIGREGNGVREGKAGEGKEGGRVRQERKGGGPTCVCLNFPYNNLRT